MLSLMPRLSGALVHEAYLRLVKQNRAAWQNRGQFFGVASQMMRRILVDRARARNMRSDLVNGRGSRSTRGHPCFLGLSWYYRRTCSWQSLR
jgi:hypothetical protein